MSQKSILSFFTSSGQSSVKETKNKIVPISKSPVKKSRNKRKVKGDNESSATPSKKLKVECENTSGASDDKVENSPNLESINVENAEAEKNSDMVSRKLPKQKKMENGEETNSFKSPTKTELDTSLQRDKLITENGVTTDSSCKIGESSSSSQNNFNDFIPKRKTARKQMISSKRNISLLKGEPVSKVDNEPKLKDMPVSNGVTNLEHKNQNSEIEVENDSLASQKTSKINNLDIENITSEVKVEDCSLVSKNSSENSNNMESEDITSEEDNSLASKKTSENKDVAKNVKAPSVLKQKANTSSKNKGSPLKKCAKLDSFFTRVKKGEDKDKTEENDKIKISSSNLEINYDSPVKKVRRKKPNVLESDDEDDESSKEVSVKKEAEVTVILEDSSLLPEKNAKPETSASEVNKTPEKKPTTENSKTDSEGQKLSIKSTSAVNTTYDPSKNNYHPVEDAFWKVNEKVPYLALAKTLELIENTSGRLKTIEILSNYFRSVIVLSPNDLLHSIYLCLNRVAPEYEGIEMGIGETLLMKAVAQATGRTVDKIKAEVAIKGDLGLVSESSRGNQRVMFTPPKLTVSSVFSKFLEIAKMSGNSAMAKKIDKIKTLFVACRDCEAKYIIRSLSGKFRIGLAEQSILTAIARAAVLTPPGQEYPPQIIDTSKGKSAPRFKEFLDSQSLILKTAYCECPNYDLIVPVLLKHGVSALPDHCHLAPGVPLKPMLAHPTDGIDRVLERFDANAFTCEFKYDGERAQIHMNDKGVVKIFSRNQEDTTSKYPDVISRISNVLKESTKSFILDSEAVAWDRKTKQILPFQVLSTRKRKDAVESEIVVQVCIMAFDLLYLNGESLVKKPLKERRSLLHSAFNVIEDQFMFAQYRDGNSAETMQEFLDESVKGNCEGLMVKSLEVDASYEIAKRSHNWLKLKKDYLQGVGDTLDLVVIGGYYGKGKRTGNYGGFLLACYDDENEEFQSICKLGTGFKDDSLEAHTKFLKSHVIEVPKSYYRYDHSLNPDEWFEPVQVWEIKCADLSVSPVHKAATGIVDPEKGISLRFPRFIRIRDDKNPEDATNSAQIADMYSRQQQIQNTASANAKAEEDYY